MNQDPADLPVILLYNMDRGWPSEDKKEMMDMAQGLAAGLTREGHPVEITSVEDDRLDKVMSRYDPDHSIVFNWCEEVPGIPRSSALVAGALESLGFTFTGADSSALSFSQDKPAVKDRLARDQIPTPRWQVFQPEEPVEWDCFPAIVKPAYEHYSYGITHEAVVHTGRELSQRVGQITGEFHQPVLVEDFIDGREFHVGIAGNGRLQVFPIAEMDFSAMREDNCRLCTYDSKFTPASSDYQMIQLRLPASLSAREKSRLEKTALAAYRATGCRDYARLDIRERDGTFYVLDVNPNADISPDTSLLLAAELAGYSYGQFGSLLVKLAAHRHPRLSRQPKKQLQAVMPAVALAD